jgi:tartrate-resistant acid phosphatase type 5
MILLLHGMLLINSSNNLSMKYIKILIIASVSVFLISAALKLPVTNSCKQNKCLSGDGSDFNFFVLGDWGRQGTIDQQAVADQMMLQSEKLHPDFIMTVGDNFYEDGVNDIQDDHWKRSFSDVYKKLTTDYDWFIALGNHDYRGKPEAEMAYHSVNPHWNLPDRYYSIVVETKDHQKVRLVFIDTSPLYNDYYTKNEMPEIKTQDSAKQYKWIDSTLANAKEPWKFVIGHHPVFSGSSHGNTVELVNRLKPLLDKYKVQAYICGHDHDLQHIKPDGSYVDYFISGSGSEGKEAGRMEGSKFTSNSLGFIDLKIKGDSLFVNYIDKDGGVIYQYSKSR